MSESLRPHGLQPTRLLYPWGFPGSNTGVGCHFLLQGIFPTQRSNPCLLLCRWILYHWSTREALDLTGLFKINFEPVDWMLFRLVCQGCHNASYRCGDFNNQNVLSQSSGNCESKITPSAGPGLLGPVSLLADGRLLALHACGPSSVCAHHCYFFACPGVPFYKGICQIGLGSTPMASLI